MAELVDDADDDGRQGDGDEGAEHAGELTAGGQRQQDHDRVEADGPAEDDGADEVALDVVDHDGEPDHQQGRRGALGHQGHGGGDGAADEGADDREEAAEEREDGDDRHQRHVEEEQADRHQRGVDDAVDGRAPHVAGQRHPAPGADRPQRRRRRRLELLEEPVAHHAPVLHEEERDDHGEDQRRQEVDEQAEPAGRAPKEPPSEEGGAGVGRVALPVPGRAAAPGDDVPGLRGVPVDLRRRQVQRPVDEPVARVVDVLGQRLAERIPLVGDAGHEPGADPDHDRRRGQEGRPGRQQRGPAVPAEPAGGGHEDGRHEQRPDDGHDDDRQPGQRHHEHEEGGGHDEDPPGDRGRRLQPGGDVPWPGASHPPSLPDAGPRVEDGPEVSWTG